MWLRIVWFWSWACYRFVLAWPWSLLRQPAYGALGWAGVYGYTDGGFAEFKEWWPIRHKLKRDVKRSTDGGTP
jgi:hypothetical protein